MSSHRTSTSAFGVSRRESHDASAFYARFRPPALSDDDTVNDVGEIANSCNIGDSRTMSAVPDNSIALVVTSPPYFVGKEYEAEILAAGAQEHARETEPDQPPSSYGEYLDMLSAVFAECQRVLEPGGRIAVNVANLGRRPYRSLAADVTRSFEDLGLLLRAEVIWQKARGSSGSCAWGSFRSPANPVLRDTTERIIIASKGRFDRAQTAADRKKAGLPWRPTITTDEFLAATLDVWELPAESAKRVNHPAPFPVELPSRLIELFTYENDVVLDPFMGAGTTLVAAKASGRRYVGYDTEAKYVELARERIKTTKAPNPATNNSATRGSRKLDDSGDKATDAAEAVLTDAGFVVERPDRGVRVANTTVPMVAKTESSVTYYIEVAGGFTTAAPGLTRAEQVWKTIALGSLIAASDSNARLLVLTPALPNPKSDLDKQIRTAGPGVIFDLIDLTSAEDLKRLTHYYRAESAPPLPGYWNASDLPSVP